MTGTSHIREARAMRDPWKKSLEALRQTPGLAGVLLVSRDGLCLVNECPRIRKPEVAAAMAAAMLAAGETLAGEFGLERKTTFHLKAGRYTLVGVGATDQLMLLGLADTNADANQVQEQLESAVNSAAPRSPW